MELAIWHWWMIAAVVFFIIEIFAPSFVAACIGVGCVAGSLTALFGGGTTAQLTLFSTATLASFVGVRPLMKKYFFRHKDALRTNVDSLIGRTARVSERIDPAGGRVVIDGDDWKALSLDGATIEKGEPVKIIKVDSIVLTVTTL